MTLAFLPSSGSHSAIAMGSVVLSSTQSSTTDGDWATLARHESRHVGQWAVLDLAGGPLAMPVLYAVDDAFFPASRNHFERAAGLAEGGYPPLTTSDRGRSGPRSVSSDCASSPPAVAADYAGPADCSPAAPQPRTHNTTTFALSTARAGSRLSATHE